MRRGTLSAASVRREESEMKINEVKELFVKNKQKKMRVICFLEERITHCDLRCESLFGIIRTSTTSYCRQAA